MKFVFKYQSELIATIPNASRLSNKDIWHKFEEALTQKFKSTLINNLYSLRDKLEEDDVEVTYDYDPISEDYNITFVTNPQLADLIQLHLRK